ncbi:MAG: amidohydrolase family protein [Planctomycetes bacterium]|nr:amidohydrolase family protein [Planctomycetota bacterium]
MKKKTNLIIAISVILIAGIVVPDVLAQKKIDIPSEVTLFKNVNIFDGKSERLKVGYDVLVVRNLIKKVAEDIPTEGTYEIDIKTGGVKESTIHGGCLETYTIRTIDEAGKTEKKEVKVNVIDGGGNTLMPGLIDGHVHLTHCIQGGLAAFENAHWQYIGATSVYMAKEHLSMGFTTVRETGGGSVGPGLKKAIDEGLIDGPRIYPSGAYISQTSGHGDFVSYGQQNQEDTNLGRLEIFRLADGPDEVTKAVRRNLAMGASQIKIMVSGGVSSEKDPMHSSQYSNEEIQAAVAAAKAWDTYVTAHIYDDANVRRALENGLLCIEHGQFITESTAKLLKRKGAFQCINFAGISPDIFKHPVYGAEGSPQNIKTKQFHAGAKNLNAVLRKVGQKVVFNTDQVFSRGYDFRRGVDYEKYAIAKAIGNHKALMAMTSTAGELMALSGKQNPYPHKLGVIEEGAYADILIVDGNPLEDITVIGASELWFDAPEREMDIPTIKIIMKDGKIYKNTVN